ncbi:MAG TPA: FkbM family methyltransferase, partial [Bacteroidia bacterium]
KANRGGNRISTKNIIDAETIQIKRLDEVKEVRSLSKIDLIKIDVEGYELKVLKGAETILRTFKPTLFIEVDNNNLSEQGDSASLLITYLNHLGYNKIINAETNTIVTPAIDFTNCHYDIIAK